MRERLGLSLCSAGVEQKRLISANGNGGFLLRILES